MTSQKDRTICCELLSDFMEGFPPVLRDWVIKGLGMSSLVYATGHIKDPVPLIEKRRGLSSLGHSDTPISGNRSPFGKGRASLIHIAQGGGVRLYHIGKLTSWGG